MRDASGLLPLHKQSGANANGGFTAREAADELSRATGSDVIQVIGRRFVLYRKNEEQ